MNYSKLSDEVIIKKIKSSVKDIEEYYFQLGFPGECIYVTPDVRQDLESECTRLALLSKNLKIEAKKASDEEAEKRKIEEELEAKKKKDEKEAKDRDIAERSIHTQDKFIRLKYRFFNHCKYNEEDIEGLEPNSSPPFFETKEEQFFEELSNGNYILYEGEYNGEDMSDKPDYIQRNLNRGFCSIVEDDFSKFFFVCFRAINVDNKCIYKSYWISNMKENPSQYFENINFKQLDNVTEFTQNFRKKNDENIIDEVYAR